MKRKYTDFNYFNRKIQIFQDVFETHGNFTPCQMVMASKEPRLGLHNFQRTKMPS